MISVPAADPVALTREWLERFVIGLGLCPFAASPYDAGRITFAVCDDESLDDIYQAFMSLLFELFTSDPGENETALLILTGGLRAFDDYLDALAMLEQVVVEAGAEGMVQIASFHPGYRFDDTDEDDPANYTNRSPYPMFHLIREDGLAAALESCADPAAIPQRNIEKLRAMGVEGICELFTKISGERRCPDAC